MDTQERIDINTDDMVGKKFGKLTVITFAGRNKWKTKMYHCLCDCGNTSTIEKKSLIKGRTKTCGKCSKNIFEFNDDYVICYTKNGDKFFIDKEDYKKIEFITWSKIKGGYIVGALGDKRIMLHRYILNINDRNIEVDHKNLDPTDNRKQNLRFATSSQNNMNQRILTKNKTGVKGVCWDKEKNKWVAQISVHNKNIKLGRFDDFKNAVKARYEAELKYQGEFRYSGNDELIFEILEGKENDKF